MLAREYVDRVIRPKQEFRDLGMTPLRDRMSSCYYNIIRKTKTVYVETKEGVIAKFKTRGRKALERNV